MTPRPLLTMRTLFTTATILTVITLLAGSGLAQPADRVFALDFTLHSDNTVSDVTAAIQEKPVKLPSQRTGAYRFTALDGDGTTIYYMDTRIDFMRKADPVGLVEEDQVDLIVRVPYVPATEEIQLSYKGKVIHTFQLPDHFCTQDRDDVCPAYCSGKGVDPDCGADSLPGPVTIAAVLLVLVLLAGGGYYAYQRHTGTSRAHEQNNGRNGKQKGGRNRRPPRRHQRRRRQ